MKTIVRTTVMLMSGAWLMLAAAPAAAQSLGVGYQFQRFSGDGESVNAPLGFNLDVSAPVAGSLSVVGQVDWSHKGESAEAFGFNAEASANFTAFAGGVRWSSPTASRVKPFVQGLAGAMHSSFSCEVAGFDCDEADLDLSSTDFLVQVGGGVVVPFNDRLGIVGQFDYRRIFGGDGEGLNSIRLVVGAQIGF